MHKQHFSPEINPTWAGYRDQKDNSANKNTLTFLTFLEGEVVHETETGSEGEFLANFTTSFLFGQGIGEPIDVIIKLPNGFFHLRHQRCKHQPLILRHSQLGW